MSIAMAQLNVRMDPRLKEAGDAVLDRVGISPTQLVRAVWMKVAQGADALDQVVETLAKEPAAAGAPVAVHASRAALIYPFEERFQEFYRETGLDPATYVEPTEEEWEEFELEDFHEWERERLISYAE